MNTSDIEITICHSPKSTIGGAEIGVQIKHIKTGIIVRSINQRSQHKNKLAAMVLLNERLLNVT